MLAVAAPAANAADNWDRASQDFGSRSVGTTSDPQNFALVATCSADSGFPAFLCTTPPGGIHNYGAITTTGPGFAIVPNTDICNNTRSGVLVTPQFASSQDVCTVQVTFKPTSGGVKTGSLSTTTSPSGAPLKVALKGIGVGTGSTTTAKKCKKKKRSASAAKKCKKRK